MSLARPTRTLLAALLLIALPCLAGAQGLPDPAAAPSPAASDDSGAPIAIADLTEDTDSRIAEGLRSIFAEVEGLGDVKVRVHSGVVTLTGTAATQAKRDQAAAIARRVEGVVTVGNAVERTLEVDSNLSPALGDITGGIRSLVRGLPLFGVALLAALVVGALGYLIAAQRWLWQSLTPNTFLAELVAGAVRVAAVIAALVLALQILDATALLGLVLGGAGVIGIALGFAVRDTVDNYVSSLMLSLRQPFRANDLVQIGDSEGRVVRLTSRATVLMTLDGNHLRIPNATVFKANILNYTRNPQRRFDFALGVDSDDDPLGAMEVGLKALRALPFVLAEPRSFAAIDTVGESSIILRFYAWVDQDQTDFLKGRSLAIQATKHAVEEAGYELPEPIYRIRIDDRRQAAKDGEDSAPRSPVAGAAPEAEDHAAPDRTIEKLVSEERGSAPEKEKDLLDTRRPIE
ncbi:MAG: mechanosensitive ion channel [Porphyrobacter sp.]|nr:mechanosensitive ion channel [Porphyrobacter sp.]